MGLGPGGQPIDANHLNKGIGMGNLGPAGENCSVPVLGITGEIQCIKVHCLGSGIWRFFKEDKCRWGKISASCLQKHCLFILAS